MFWSFDDSDLANSKKDQVRLLVGDTDATDKQISDDAIAFYLSSNGGNPHLAAAEVCEALAGKYARQVDRKIGSTSVSSSKRAEAYRGRAAELRSRAAAFCSITFGGQSRAAASDLEQDADAIPSRFRRGQDSSEDHLLDAVRPPSWNNAD